MLTRPSISRRDAAASRDTLARIDSDDRQQPHRTAAPILVLAAFGLVIGFVFAQAVAFAVVNAAWGSIDIEARLGATAALRLSAIQAAGIAFALALVASGISSLRRIGLRASRAEAGRGWWALAPVGLVVLLPSVAYALATDGELVHAGVSIGDALAYVLLAVLIAVNEELWFRGLVVDALGGEARPWLVVGVSAILFGLPHFGNDAAAILNMIGVTLAVGIPFAVVRLRHRALLPLIGWHALIDIWAFLHTSSVIAEGDPSTGELAAGLFVPAVLAIAYATWFARTSTPVEQSA